MGWPPILGCSVASRIGSRPPTTQKDEQLRKCIDGYLIHVLKLQVSHILPCHHYEILNCSLYGIWNRNYLKWIESLIFLHFSTPNAPDTVFVSTPGFRNWKKATMRDAGFSKYTSKIIQNEVLGCLAEMVRSEIMEEVKISEVFSIMADETKDISKREQISFTLRYYYNGAIKESFLHFESAERLDAAGLTGKIVHLLEHYGLDYKKNLIGQAYDSAAVMSGQHSGVQARIKEQAKFAFYIHCSAHCLNLVLVDVVKSVPETEEFFSLLQSLYIFTSASYVHPKWLSLQREMYGKTRELQRLSDTRWACRFLALRNIMDTLPALKRLLQEIAQEHHGEKTVEARGLLAQIDLEFVVHLVTLRKLFGETKLLSDMLQSETVDLSRAVVNALVQTLNDHRQESFFDKLWDEALNICEQLSDMFRTSFFYPVIDSMLNELNRRFSNTNCELMRSIQSLSPQSDAFLKEILDRKIQSGEVKKPFSTVELVRFIEPYREVFFELFRLCKIAVTLPVSSASCERSFSTLKLIKTFLRSTTMSHPRRRVNQVSGIRD
uniref:DUF4371 domain-containing protein n=1 Tax=Paramormyrops kingsleyae TaxID=1676925 RepID=A0A3B3T0S8_9TELE